MNNTARMMMTAATVWVGLVIVMALVFGVSGALFIKAGEVALGLSAIAGAVVSVSGSVVAYLALATFAEIADDVAPRS